MFADLRIEGNVDLNGFNLTIQADQSTATDIDRISFGRVGDPVGVVSGNGNIVKQGDGTVSFVGTASNTYVGTTTVNGGEFQLDRTSGATVIPGALTIGDGIGVVDGDYVLVLNQNEQIADATAVTITAGTGALILGGITETIGSLAGGGNVFLVGGELVAGANGASTAFSGVISGDGVTLPSSAGNLTKTGAGTLTLTGNNNYDGTTKVSAGTLLVNGSQPFSAVSVAGGTLGGTGTVGPISGTSGTVAPGVSPGILTVVGNPALAGLTFAVELNGLTAGTGYDQLRVQGTPNLTGGTLNVTLNFAPSAGSSFTIVDNDGTADPVVGTFTGLAEGATLVVGGRTFRITYVGGDGNDVVLSLPNVPPTAVNDSATTAEDTPAVVAVLGNDSDSDGTLNPASVVVTSGPTNGTSAVNTSTGAITYTPAANYNGPDSLTYTVRDDLGAVSNTATVSLTVTPVNDPPVNTLPPSPTTPGNTPLVFSGANTISIADPDAGGADIQTVLSVPLGQGTLAPGAAGNVPPLTTVTGSGTNSLTLVGSLAEVNAALAGLTYTPPAGFTGTVALTMTTNDLGNAPAPAQQDQSTRSRSTSAPCRPSPSTTRPP